MMTVTQPTTTTTPPQIIQVYQEFCTQTTVNLLKAAVGFLQTRTNSTLKGQKAREQNSDFIEVVHRISALLTFSESEIRLE